MKVEYILNSQVMFTVEAHNFDLKKFKLFFSEIIEFIPELKAFIKSYVGIISKSKDILGKFTLIENDSMDFLNVLIKNKISSYEKIMADTDISYNQDLLELHGIDIKSLELKITLSDQEEETFGINQVKVLYLNKIKGFPLSKKRNSYTLEVPTFGIEYLLAFLLSNDSESVRPLFSLLKSQEAYYKSLPSTAKTFSLDL